MRIWPALAAIVLASCGSVELPREHFWRLDLPAPAGGELPRAGTLRVLDLQLGNALSGDCLVRADGPLHLEPLELQRWVAPLDRLITDATILGLTRTRMFAVVKGAGDGGGEDWTIGGRIVDFSEHTGEPVGTGYAHFVFWLDRAGEVLFAEEFHAEVPLARPGAEATVASLSHALQQVLDELVGKMRAAGVFEHRVDASPPGR